MLRLFHFYQIFPELVKKTIVFVAGRSPGSAGAVSRCGGRQLWKVFSDSSRIAFQSSFSDFTPRSAIR